MKPTKPTKQELIDTAAELGRALNVTPFPVRGKHPLTPSGALAWTNGARAWNLDLHRVWWQQAVDPDGIGVALPHPYVVVDLDPQVVNGDQSTAYLLAKDELTTKLTDLAVHRLGIPASAPRVLTGKGLHVWVKLRNGNASNQEVNRLLHGVVLTLPVSGTGELIRVRVQADLKGGGTGYVVCPPSWSEAGQRCYEWIHRQPAGLDDLPDWSPDDGQIAPLVAVWCEGRRHHLALSVAGALAKGGVPQAQAEAVVRRAAELAEDEELANRIQAVQDTYRKVAEQVEVIGRAGLELVLDEHELRPVLSALDTIISIHGKGDGSVIRCESEGSWAMSEMLAGMDEFTSAYKYLVDTREWMHWTGAVWARVEPEVVVLAGRELLLRHAFQQLRDYPVSKDVQRRAKQLIDWCNDEHKPYNMLRDLTTRARVRLSLDQCDQDPDLLNTPSGVVNLATGALMEHRPDYYMTRITQADYIPEAEHELVELCLTHLKRCLTTDSGSPSEWDIQLYVDFIQRALGYSLTGYVHEKCAFLVVGPGDAGKSTFFEACCFALGSYAGKLPWDALYQASKSEPDRPRPSLITLPGKRMVIASEGSGNHKLDVRTFKELTGMDTITVRPLYGRYISFRPQCKLWLATNTEDVPRISFTDSAVWNRVYKITFGFSIPKEQQDRWLLHKFRGDKQAQAALLAWMVRGAMAWHREGGLHPPGIILRHTHELRMEMDPLQEFGTTYLEFGPDYTTEAGELRRLYEQTTKRPISNQAWGAWLRAHGCEPVRTRINGQQVKAWRGVRIKGTSTDDDVDPFPDDDDDAGDDAGAGEWNWAGTP
jgi:P4 family phage/plasmid primase-like protien